MPPPRIRIGPSSEARIPSINWYHTGDVIEPSGGNWRVRFGSTVPDIPESSFELDFGKDPEFIDLVGDLEPWEGPIDDPNPPKKPDPTDPFTHSFAEPFKHDKPCAELKRSKAMNMNKFGQGDYPPGEVDFWLDKLSEVKDPNVLAKIRAWNGSRKLFDDLTRDKNSMKSWFEKIKDTLTDPSWDNFEKVFEKSMSWIFDYYVFNVLLDEAKSAALNRVYWNWDTFDIIDWVTQLSKRPDESAGIFKDLLYEISVGWVSAEMLKDVFANTFEMLKAYADLLIANREKDPNNDADQQDTDYLDDIFNKVFNKDETLLGYLFGERDNALQMQVVVGFLQDYLYLDMVGAWMDYYRATDSEYNKTFENGESYRRRCLQQDDAAMDKISKDRDRFAQITLMYSHANFQDPKMLIDPGGAPTRSDLKSAPLLLNNYPSPSWYS